MVSLLGTYKLRVFPIYKVGSSVAWKADLGRAEKTDKELAFGFCKGQDKCKGSRGGDSSF
jgi:hypothetical protein